MNDPAPLKADSVCFVDKPAKSRFAHSTSGTRPPPTRSARIESLRERFDRSSLKVILGAGEQRWPGWVPTQREDLDLRDPASFARWFGARRADAFLCEHVWEHLTEAEGRAAARLCSEYLKPGGWLRCAVPDAHFPDPDYQRTVQIGGPGPADHPAADHQIVYDHRLFVDVFASAGFGVRLLECCDEAGRFHAEDWDLDAGPVYRSLRLDHRNRGGRLGFVSLIVEARKPVGDA